MIETIIAVVVTTGPSTTVIMDTIGHDPEMARREAVTDPAVETGAMIITGDLSTTATDPTTATMTIQDAVIEIIIATTMALEGAPILILRGEADLVMHRVLCLFHTPYPR